MGNPIKSGVFEPNTGVKNPNAVSGAIRVCVVWILVPTLQGQQKNLKGHSASFAYKNTFTYSTA